MTDKRSYTDCLRAVLGRGGPLQAFHRNAMYWIVPTLEQACAEARKAGLVSLYRPHEHCWRGRFVPANTGLERSPVPAGQLAFTAAAQPRVGRR